MKSQVGVGSQFSFTFNLEPLKNIPSNVQTGMSRLINLNRRQNPLSKKPKPVTETSEPKISLKKEKISETSLQDACLSQIDDLSSRDE